MKRMRVAEIEAKNELGHMWPERNCPANQSRIYVT